MSQALASELSPSEMADRLKRVRESIDALEREEEYLTTQIKLYMADQNVTEIRGKRARAYLDSRAVNIVDIPKLVRACGSLANALPALKASVEKARELLPGLVVDRCCVKKKEVILKSERL